MIPPVASSRWRHSLIPFHQVKCQLHFCVFMDISTSWEVPASPHPLGLAVSMELNWFCVHFLIESLISQGKRTLNGIHGLKGYKAFLALLFMWGKMCFTADILGSNTALRGDIRFGAEFTTPKPCPYYFSSLVNKVPWKRWCVVKHIYSLSINT